MERMANPEKGDKPEGRGDRGDRISLVVQTAAILFLCAATAGYVLFDRAELHDLQRVAIFLGPPASAALLFVAAALGFPNLLAPGRIAFPLNLTLPIVFVLLIRVSVILWATQSSAVFRAFDPLIPALSWVGIGPLFVSAMLQCLVLSIIVIVGNR